MKNITLCLYKINTFFRFYMIMDFLWIKTDTTIQILELLCLVG